MYIKIKHKGSKVEVNNDYSYLNYVDVKSFILETIRTTIEDLNKD